jgi:hypothetical protein
MFKPTSTLARSLLALALLAGSAAAMAAPTYHVSIDSTGQSGSGELILSFLTEDPAPTAVASVSGLSGAGLLGTGTAYNDATVDFGARTLRLPSGLNGYLFDVTLGGKFSFDVGFNVDNAVYEAIFGTGLADLDGNYLTGTDLVDITLSPDSAIQAVANPAYASVEAVSAVPEPSTLLSLVTGLGLLGFGLRRRAR